MPIKIIDTLTPAGDFDVVNASDVGYNDPEGAPAAGSLEAAVYDLRQAVGLTVGDEESIADKLGTAAKPESAPGAGDAIVASGLYKAVSETEAAITSTIGDVADGISGKIGTLEGEATLVSLLTAILGQVDEKTTANLSEELANKLGFTGEGEDTAASRISALSTALTGLFADDGSFTAKLGLDEDNTTVASLIGAAVRTLRDTYGAAATTGDTPTAATGLYAETDAIKNLITDPDNGLAQNITHISDKLGKPEVGEAEEATGLYKAVSESENAISDKIGTLDEGETLATLLTAIDSELGFTSSETARQTLINKLGLTGTNANKTVASLITDAVTDLQGTPGSTDGKKTLTSIETSIQSIRELINTINPPSLTITGGGGAYGVNCTQDKTITVSINRYLEAPLEIFVKDDDIYEGKYPKPYTKLAFGTNSLTKTYKWTPTLDSIGKKTIKVLYINNSEGSTSDGTALPKNSIILESKDISCSFTLPVYWFQSTAESIGALPADCSSNSTNLTYGHPNSITFGGTGYCYYLYPKAGAFSKPKFVINGQNQSDGFLTQSDLSLTITLDEENEITCTHTYNVYRSENSLGNTTVNFS